MLNLRESHITIIAVLFCIYNSTYVGTLQSLGQLVMMKSTIFCLHLLIINILDLYIHIMCRI